MKVETPDDAVATPSTEWKGAITSTVDCANGGGAAEADKITLLYAEEALSVTPHEPIVTGGVLHVNQPILLWRSVCNKSSAAAGALTVNWSRAACVNINDCAPAVPLAPFTVPAQDKCQCAVAFVEDRVGDAAGETAGFYRYALSFNNTELASALVRVEN